VLRYPNKEIARTCFGIKNIRKNARAHTTQQDTRKNVRVRYIPGNKEERAHGVHVAKGRLSLGHLDGGDAEAPEVAPVVVRGVWVLVAGDHLGGHPVGRPDKSVPAQDTRLVSNRAQRDK
jgi:hypothetical protein